MSVEAYGVRSTVATSNHTQNYDLPLWEGGDVTSWMGNLNDAFNKIDTGIFQAQKAVNGIKEIGENLQKLFDEQTDFNDKTKQALTELSKNVGDVALTLTQMQSDITNANTAIENLDTEQKSNQMLIEALQDDIGKLMEWESGMVYIPDEADAKLSDDVTISYFARSSSIILVGLQVSAHQENKWFNLSTEFYAKIKAKLFPEFDDFNLYTFNEVYFDNAGGYIGSSNLSGTNMITIGVNNTSASNNRFLAKAVLSARKE